MAPPGNQAVNGENKHQPKYRKKPVYSTQFMVFTTGQGAHGFTLDPSVGDFLLSHPDIRIPEEGKIYSVNESYWHYWDEPTKKAVSYFKSPTNKRGQPYSLRYIGSLVADFHRNLLSGGIFMYPADFREPKKPRGKLRLMCEANPLAKIVEEAGAWPRTEKRASWKLSPKNSISGPPCLSGLRTMC